MKISNMDTLKGIIKCKGEAAEICMELSVKIKCFQEIFEQEKPKNMEENCSIMNAPAGVEMIDYFRRVIRAESDVGVQLLKFCADELMSSLDNNRIAFLLYKDVIESLCEEHKKVFSPKEIISVFLGHILAREDSVFDNLQEWLNTGEE